MRVGDTIQIKKPALTEAEQRKTFGFMWMIDMDHLEGADLTVKNIDVTTRKIFINESDRYIHPVWVVSHRSTGTGDPPTNKGLNLCWKCGGQTVLRSGLTSRYQYCPHCRF